MNAQIKLMMLAGFVCISLSFAGILPETEGMEQETRGDGTFLTASPTYSFDRTSRIGGIQSESEEWSPDKLRFRYFVNRMSITPSWAIQAPAIWLSTGNEIGDLIYEDLLVGGIKSGIYNRTPMLEAGFRSKPYRGFWATTRAFQVDHFAVNTLKERSSAVDIENFANFGENLPFFSTVYAGFGYSTNKIESSLLVGREFVWLMGESGRWIPIEYKPRIEALFDFDDIHASVVYENANFQHKAKKETGRRQEINGSLKLGSDSIAMSKESWNFALGVAFRAVNDSGNVYFGLKDNYVIFPFLEYAFNPTNRLNIGGFIGTSGENFASKDSVNLNFGKFFGTKANVGFKNHIASSLNPLGETYEYYDNDTLNLSVDGFMQLHRAYLNIEGRSEYIGLGMNFAGWVEKGAETFSVDSFKKSNGLTYRTGDLTRIDSWIRAVSAEANASLYYKKMFSLSSKAGFEKIEGDNERFEVIPAEGWVALSASWNLSDRFLIDHSWTYRTNAKWNLRTEDPYVIKGVWYWNASFSQLFPEYGISLTGTILHSLRNDQIQVPNGGYDRTRFYCNIRKNF